MSNKLHIIGLSGGIATGKSTCVGIMRDECPECVVFDADACVRQLYRRQDIRDELAGLFGAGVVMQNAEIDKAVIRERAFADPGMKQALEDIFHPRVREECLALLGETAKRRVSRLFVADIPLLFEGGFDFGQSANLLVATRRQTQIERLKNRNAWSDNAAQAVVDAQMPLEKKMPIADIVFWNEGPVAILENQCGRYLRSLGLVR